jgi:prepilin-type N-terminal cleavage/methylation domain-containing protein
MKFNNKGFTLIELLVVIAIIGILSGLIIVSMSGANNSAKDARLQADMDQFRTSAELYKINNSNLYSSTGSAVALTDCTATASTFMATGGDNKKLCDDMVTYDGSGTPSIRINAGGTAYCAAFDLLGGTFWCVDSTGYAGTAAAIADCDATNFNCAP